MDYSLYFDNIDRDNKISFTLEIFDDKNKNFFNVVEKHINVISSKTEDLLDQLDNLLVNKHIIYKEENFCANLWVYEIGSIKLMLICGTTIKQVIAHDSFVLEMDYNEINIEIFYGILINVICKTILRTNQELPEYISNKLKSHNERFKILKIIPDENVEISENKENSFIYSDDDEDEIDRYKNIIIDQSKLNKSLTSENLKLTNDKILIQTTNESLKRELISLKKQLKIN